MRFGIFCRPAWRGYETHEKISTPLRRLEHSDRRRRKTSTRRRCRIPCVVVEKITRRRREDGGVVVDKNVKSRRTFNKNSSDLLTSYNNNTQTGSIFLIKKWSISGALRQQGLQNDESKTIDDLTIALVPIKTKKSHWKKINMNFEEKIKTT